MKSYWRSLLGVSLASALAVSPLLVLAIARGRLHPTPLQHYLSPGSATWRQIAEVYVGLTFVCFILFLFIGVLLVYLSAMIDRVPPPFPRPEPEADQQHKD